MMNPRRITLTLGAAVGAALAAAMIPAGVAHATVGSAGGEGVLNSDLSTFFTDNGLTAELAKTDVTLTDEFIGQLPGGPTGTLGHEFETDLENQINNFTSTEVAPSPPGPSYEGVADKDLSFLLSDLHESSLATTDVSDLNAILGELGGVGGMVGNSAANDISMVFAELIHSVIGV